MRRHRYALIAIAVAVLPLGGCAQFSESAGMALVQDVAATELKKDVVKVSDPGHAEVVQAQIRSILARRLDVEAAVQVALLNNRGLQAAFASLGSAEAQSVEAGLPPSPTFALARLVATGQLEIERQIVQSLLGLATLPHRREIAEARFRQAQLKTAEAVLRLAADMRRAYYRAVAATQSVQFLDEAKVAADASSEVAKRLGETGALNKLDQSREHAFTAELGAELATARLMARTERERLTRLMGLWGRDVDFKLAARLPKLPARPKILREIERDAIERRIDLRIARDDLDILAKQLGLTEQTRLVNALEIGGILKTERERTVAGVEKTRWRGVELEIQVPLFDFGRARVRNAEQLYLQAVHRLAEKAINIRSEVREAYQVYRGTYDIARHYESEVLPLRAAISEETLLRYNAMVSDLAQLLADARARTASHRAAIAALRDHWLAAAELQAAMIGGGMSASPLTSAEAAPTAGATGSGH